jgi:hypothetical protein
VKFDLPHAAVGAGVVRIEADGQGERVEPQCAARPGGRWPTVLDLTPQDLSPRRDMLPGRCPKHAANSSESA